MSNHTGLEIAIIGMAGQFPGAEDVDRFWQNLKNSEESITSLADQDILNEGEDRSILQDPFYIRANAFVSGKEYFDADFFGYRPGEAKIMDPQMRLFHENCWKAMEDAGYDLARVKDKIGVFAGATSNYNWEVFSILANRQNDVDDFTASQLRNVNYLCSRVAYKMNLQGPVMFINTACSTSLVTIERAVMSLILRECNMAMAGGVTINNYTYQGYQYKEGMILSKDGHCRPFDSDASGTVAGEGVGVVVLKRLADAIKDRDNIYAVIKGAAVNNDGHQKVSFTAPSPNGQYLCVLKAINMARIQPESISYVEAHGTGTLLGDPIEVEALNRIFGESSKKYCALGSVKGNVGHLDAAAGVTGFIKTVLSLYHRKIPASLHYKTANPEIDFSKSPLYVNTELREWANDTYPLRAGVSSFGIGGTNAHIILEEAPVPEASSASRPYQLFLFSAKTINSLKRYTAKMSEYLLSCEHAKLPDVAYTLHVGRSHFRYRKAIVCSTVEDAVAKIQALKDLDTTSAIPEKRRKRIVFMFPGQGAQYHQMCQGLYQQEAFFRSVADSCFAIVNRISGIDLKKVLFDIGPGAGDLIDQTEYTQPLLFIVEYSLARLLQKWGISPDIMIGHSIGEYVAACISGVFSLEDCLSLVLKRGSFMQQAPRGVMLSVFAKEHDLRKYLEDNRAVSLAAINSTEFCVVSGEVTTIDHFKTALERSGINCKIIRTSHAFHSHMMDGIVADFIQEVKKIKTNTGSIPFISNLTGNYITGEEYTDPGYWGRHLRETVNFRGGIDTLLSNEELLFVEVGPGRSLAGFVRSHERRTPEHKVVNLIRHVQEESVDDVAQLLKGVGELWTEGVEPLWDEFYENETRNRVAIPTYEFEKIKYPVNVNAGRILSNMIIDKTGKNKDISQWFYVPSWKLTPLSLNTKKPHAHCIMIFSDDVMGNGLQAELQSKADRIIRVTPAKKFREISPLQYELNPSSADDYTLLVARLSSHRYLPDTIVHAWNLIPQYEPGDDEQIKDLVFYSVVELIKAFYISGKLSEKNFILFTKDLHPVLHKTQRGVLQALPAGLLKVISQEYPTVLTTHIDISSDDLEDKELLKWLSAEVLSPGRGREISYRQSARWERLYEKVEANRDIHPLIFKQRGVYVITGGLGAVGYTFAEYLLKNYQATVWLLGRTSLPETGEWPTVLQNERTNGHTRSRIVKMQELSKSGGQVIYRPCDTTDETSLAKTLNEIEAASGNINGIIHAAGKLPESLPKITTELTRHDFENYLEAKVKGLEILKHVTDKREPDFVLVTSSVATVLGGIGFGGYAPANNFINYFINSQRLTGNCERWLSINLDALDLQHSYSDGAIGKEELNEVLERAMGILSVSQVFVSAGDLNGRLEKWVYSAKGAAGDLPEGANGMDLLTIPEDQSNTVDVENSTIQKLSVIWQHFFGKGTVGAGDDFFESGGDSLKALTIINRISKAFRVDISVKDFFNHATITKLATYIDSKKAIPELLQSLSITGDIPSCSFKPYYKLSAAQKRLYFLHEFDKSSLAYNMLRFVQLEGDLDKDRLNEVLTQLVLRHDSLRTSFVLVDGEPWQKIVDHTTLNIEYYSANDAGIPERIKEFIRPFDLSQGPLLRVGLLRIAARKHLLMVDIHHIINDGISEDILIKDFLSLYRGETLPPLPLQYKDYAEWQQSSREQERITAQKVFWLGEFSEDVTPLELPFDYSRPAVKSEQGDCVNFSFSATQTAALRNLASGEGASMFMVLLALYNVLLSKLSNQEDIVIGIPTAGRQHADLEGIIGMFVNTLPLRNYPKGSMSFKELLAAVKLKTLSALQNQEYQYEDLIEVLQVSRDMSRNPLFDVVLSYQNYEETSLELPGITISTYNREHRTAKFDLTLVVWEANDQLQGSFEYCTALFSQQTVRRFAAYLQQIVNTVVKDTAIRVADIEVIDSEEKHQLLYGLDNTAVAWPHHETIVSLFNKQVIKFGEKTAVELAGESISYRQLQEKSNQLAWWLRQEGVATGSIVALLTDRSIDTIVGMLAILKAGGAYLPIDVDYPAERIQYMLSDSAASLLLTTHKEFAVNQNIPTIWLQDDRIASYSLESPDHINQPEDVCYIIYTSGTTGRPKGVMIDHSNVVRLLFNASLPFDFTADDVWTMFHSHCFDFSVWEIYGALLYGGKLVIVPKDIAKDPVLYLKILKDKQVTIVNQTPSAFYNLIQADEQDPKPGMQVRYVIFGGEALHPGRLKSWYEKYPQVKLINMYGITETTVHVTYKEIGSAEITKNISNIGVPIATLSAYVFDKYTKLVPRGVKGELYVGGAGVGKGYLNKEELTKQRFIDNPYKAGERLYKSGDLVKLMASGDLEYAGRIDEQVKIRGYRIELGEIEQQLNTYTNIKESVVVVREREGNKYLVAYYVSVVNPDGAALRNYLLQRLPDYMVPSFFVHLDQLPLTANGKLDRKALPEPTITGSEEYTSAVTPAQQLLVDIWSKVLGIERIGINDNFFSAGGDSIKSIQIIARVRAAGYDLTVKDIFTSQTIALLCSRLKSIETVADQSMVTGESLLSPIQHWFFAKHHEQPHHYNQAVMLHFNEGINVEMVKTMFEKLQEHHDGLRTVFKKIVTGWKAMIVPASQLKLSINEYDFRGKNDVSESLEVACNEVQSGMDLANGPLMRLGLFHLDDGSRLLIVIHHLVIDGISWRILFEDIETIFQQLLMQEKISLPLKTASFRDWVSLLHDHSQTKGFMEAMEYWKMVMNRRLLPMARDNEDGLNRVKDRTIRRFSLTSEKTEKLLTQVHNAYHTQINDILLAALLSALHRGFGLQQVKIDMEGHGREPVEGGVNVSRTVGWFTSIYPVILEHQEGYAGQLLKYVKENLRRVPNNGIDYFIGKYITNVSAIANKGDDACILFNYLGQFDSDTRNRSYAIAKESAGETIAAESRCAYDWEIVGMVVSGELKMSIHYSRFQYFEATIEKLMVIYQEELERLIEHCCTCRSGELTPSDLTYGKLSIGQLDKLQDQYAIEDIYPLSPMQEGMLFHALLNSASEMYFEQIMYRWEGGLDKDAVRKCIENILLRYDVLRTKFVHEGYGRPLQIVLKNVDVQYIYIDIREELKRDSSARIIKNYQQEDRNRRFDLRKDVLMRLTILRTGTSQYEFIWSHHHILMDGWCMGLIIEDFRKMYKSEIDGKRLVLDPAPRYAGYIKWLEKRDKEQSFNYWRSYLHEYNAIPVFPRKRSVALASAETQFSKYQFSLDQRLTEQLKTLAVQCAATLNTVFQAAWGILLSKYNNMQDVVFGSVVSGRSAEVEGIEKMVGLFINTIPVRIKYEDPDTIGSLIRRIQEEALQAEPHHYNSLAEIQSTSGVGRNLIDHIIVFENYPVSKELSADNQNTQGGYKITNVEAFEQTNYDLSVMVMPGETLEVGIHYNVACYDTSTIEAISLHLIHIFDQLLQSDKKVTDVELVTEKERNMLLNYFNNTLVDYPQDVTIVDLFEEHVKRAPGSMAVCCGSRQVSYTQLNNLAESIAGRLLEQTTLEINDTIAFMANPSIEMIAIMLAILRVGCAYVALSPEAPVIRNQLIFDDSGAKLLVVQKTVIEQKPEAATLAKENELLIVDENADKVALANMAALAKPVNKQIDKNERLIYIIYTSGSTGTPKGVEVRMSGIVNMIQFYHQAFAFKPGEKVSQVANICFDASAFEIWPCLTGGGQLYIASPDIRLDTGLMEDWLISNQIGFTFQPPAIAERLLKRKEIIRSGSLKVMNVAGDVLNYYPQEKLPFKLFNLYGPTEDSVWTTWNELRYDRTMHNYSIGKPIANKKVYMVDKHNKLLPIGVAGELCISGKGLAKGYLNNETLAKQKFINNPFEPGEVMYKTGDLAKWSYEGEIEFLGRIDTQVKIRGFRIELGEIESSVKEFDKILEAAVVVHGENEGRSLVVYYTSPQAIDAQDIKKHLTERLPDYMVPSFFIQLQKLPYSISGKLDKKSLPAPVFEASGKSMVPVNDVQKELVAIWSGILGIDVHKIGITDNFFDIGGNSIRLMSMVEQLNARFNTQLSVAGIFKFPEIRSIANYILENDQVPVHDHAREEEGLEQMRKTLNVLNGI